MNLTNVAIFAHRIRKEPFMKKYIICTLLISLSLIACGRKNVKNPHQKEKTVQVHFQGNHFKKTDLELLGLRGKVKRLEEIFDYYEYAEDGSAKKLDVAAVLPREGTFFSTINGLPLIIDFDEEGYIIGTRRYEDTGIDSLIYNYKEKTITQYTGDKKQYIDCYKYDERGNVIEKRWGPVGLPSHKYYHITYNNRGQKIKEISSISKTKIELGKETIYKYDSKGRIIYEERKGILGEIREYTYNREGDIQTIKKKPFLEPDQELWYEYTYDKQGNYIKSILYLKDKIEGKLTSRVTQRKIEYY